MSTNLYWIPADVPPPRRGGWKHPLKGIISKKYLGHDGSLVSERVVLDTNDLPFIQGLAAAGLEDAKDLADAVEQHKTIVVWTE